MANIEKWDGISVIGGGILAWNVAAVLSEAGYPVKVFASEGKEPRTDSQRSHAWLQSGLHYMGSENVSSAKNMFYAGLDMHDYYGFAPPKKRGVFSFSNRMESDSFLDYAASLKLRNSVDEIPSETALELLGPFFREANVHFFVPDAPFDEAGIMTEARARAIHNGSEQIGGEVRLQRNEMSRSGYLICAEDVILDSLFTVVCAGCGTPILLDHLEIEHCVKVYQSGLLIFDSCAHVNAPLYVDKSNGLTWVRWPPNRYVPHGCVVVGGGEPIGPLDHKKLQSSFSRTLTTSEKETLESRIPRNWLRAMPKSRGTAGYKTEILLENNMPTVDPWIHQCLDYPGLIFSLPGKATLALDTARRILTMVSDRVVGMQAAEVRVGTQGGSFYGPRILSHWCYPYHDDSE